MALLKVVRLAVLRVQCWGWQSVDMMDAHRVATKV
jgi:hypothetical protein